MVSQQIVDIIIKAQDQASAAAQKVDNSLQKIGQSSNRLSKIPGFDALRTKFSSIATSIDGKLGGALTRARNRFNTIRTTVGNAASSIRSRFGGAIDGVRSKLASLSKGSNGLASAMGFLKGAVSMTAGMIGYDLFNSLMENTKASINARSGMQAFATRLNMSGTEVAKFQADLDKMQGSFKKIDMDVVGQQATDMAYRLGLPKTALSELTETTAIFTDAMQRNGRSAEDSMLAMSDAMDGQFVRLKEIGIGQEDLMKNGWSGDINDKTGLLKAMNAALKEQHYDDLAKSVDTLDDAWQVLSITLSNLLESIILPLTPAITGMISGFTDSIGKIKEFFTNNGWAQGAAVIAGLAAGFVFLAGSLVTAEGAFIGLEALMPGFVAGLFSAASGFMAITVAGAPLWAIVAAVAAIAFAVYEVGIAFGWWKDLGTMFEAISAGAQRMWSAFVNHPDVQAAISMISSALSTLWSWIQQAGQAVLDFFNINSSGSFDIVRVLIDGIGQAWEAMTVPIRTVISVLQILYPYMESLYSNVLVPIGEFLGGQFTDIWNALISVWGDVTGAVSAIISVFDQFKQGQVDLPTLIMTVVTTIFNLWLNLATTLGGLLLSLAGRMWEYASAAGMNFLTGIANYLRLVPGRVLAYLQATYARIVGQLNKWVSTSRSKAGNMVNGIYNYLRALPARMLSYLAAAAGHIISQGQRWVTNARTKAMSVLTGVATYISLIPGRIYSYLSSAVSNIISAGQAWVDAAREKAQAVVDGVRNALSGTASAVSGALSGVADAIVRPFRDAYNTAKGIWDSIASLASNTPRVASAGGEGMSEYLDASTGAVASGTLGVIGGSTDVKVNGKLALNVNVSGLANGTDKRTVENIFNRMVNDKSFKDQLIREIAGSTLFQSLDAKEKAKLLGKSNRSIGI